MIPKRLLEDLVLGEPHRLAIVCALACRGGRASFVEVRDALALTDGNLNRHLHRLESGGLVEQRRTRRDRGRPWTMIELTAVGRGRLASFAGALREAAGIAAAVAEQPARGEAVAAETSWVEAAEGRGGRREAPMVDERFVGPD